MTRKALLLILLGSAVVGAVDTYMDAMLAGGQPWAWRLASTCLLSFLVFNWYHADSNARGYPRSRWLNLSVIIAGFLAIPYYLVRSRPRGQKIKALFWMASCIVLMFVSSTLGAMSTVLLA